MYYRHPHGDAASRVVCATLRHIAGTCRSRVPWVRMGRRACGHARRECRGAPHRIQRMRTYLYAAQAGL